MYRVAVPVLFVVAVILALVGGAPMRSDALEGTPSSAATPTPDGLCEFGSPAAWEFADVRPAAELAALVSPAVTPTPNDDRQLYLVVITLPPGHCMPYTTLGNQKKGAIVMIVQQGTVAYKWELKDPNSTPIVLRGDSASLQGSTMLAGAMQLFYPGDWITLDQEVQFSYRNVGGDSAIILKAVFADPSPGGGCSGGCR